ncbi:hypothetical protein ACJX0J_010148, partial [Zea mays]
MVFLNDRLTKNCMAWLPGSIFGIFTTTIHIVTITVATITTKDRTITKLRAEKLRHDEDILCDLCRMLELRNVSVDQWSVPWFSREWLVWSCTAWHTGHCPAAHRTVRCAILQHTQVFCSNQIVPQNGRTPLANEIY